MKKKSLILSLIVLFINNLQAQTVLETKEFEIVISKVIQIEENIEPISDIHSIALNTDGSFYLTSRRVAQLLKYDSTGHQIKKISRWGRGPYEYQNPSVLKVYKDRLYVWDMKSFKLIIFDTDGNGVKELNLFASSVTDFDVTENRVVFYSQNSTGNYIKAFDLETGDLLFKTGYDIENKMEHLLLMMFEGSGNLASNSQNIYYSLPYRSGIVKYSIDDNENDFNHLPDDRFEVESSGYDNRQEINQNINEAIKYPFFNSRNLGAFVLSNYIISINENGLYNPDDLGERWNLNYDFEESQRRRHTIFVLSPALELIDIITLSSELQKQIGLKIVGVHNNEIIYLKKTYDNTANQVNRKIIFLKIKRIDK